MSRTLEQKLIHEVENTLGRILNEDEKEVVILTLDVLINSNLIKNKGEFIC